MKLRIVDCFLLLGILLIPFSFHLLSFQPELIRLLFVPINSKLATTLGFHPLFFDLSSDSILFYMHFLLLVLLSFVAMVLIKNQISDIRQLKIKQIIQLAAAYYLSLILLKYGFDKLFKAQFPLPEPNLLFTPLGKLDKDILFWSTMGSSRSYCIFMGLAEIIPAILLLYRRTRGIGALLSVMVLINVLAVNFSFDISVKLYSAFLLSLALYLAFPTLQTIFKILIQQQIVLPYEDKLWNFNAKPFVKTAIILLIFAEALIPYLKSGIFNDDIAPRHHLAGAYENVDQSSEIKRIFIHRDSYLIFQNINDEMSDYKMSINSLKNTFEVIDYEENKFVIPFNFNRKTNELLIELQNHKKFKFEKIYTSHLPLMQKQFHWMVD
ncbi:MAG: hypothetical protein V4638_03430 [Bacteroidota bacterium]